MFNNNDTQLTTESLFEARQRLLDASGTLSFLVNDLASSAPNPTGLRTHAIQEPLQDLRDSLTQLIHTLSTLIEKSHDSDYFDNIDVAYAAPTLIQQGAGRKRFDISKDQLEHLRSLFFSWEKIASLLHVSISTLQRQRKEFGLTDEFKNYSDISDNELDQIYASIAGRPDEGPCTPNIGRRRFIGALRSRGLNVQRWRVSDCLHRVDPVGTALCW